MKGEARLAAEFADEMLKRGVFVIGFSYPVKLSITIYKSVVMAMRINQSAVVYLIYKDSQNMDTFLSFHWLLIIMVDLLNWQVVPKGKARIRVQISAAHTEDEILHTVDAFTQVAKTRGVL